MQGYWTCSERQIPVCTQVLSNPAAVWECRSCSEKGLEILVWWLHYSKDRECHVIEGGGQAMWRELEGPHRNLESIFQPFRDREEVTLGKDTFRCTSSIQYSPLVCRGYIPRPQ